MCLSRRKTAARHAQWGKETVLAVLLSGRLPTEMLEKNWNKKAPDSIRDDRDILLVRLSHNFFSHDYRYYSKNFISDVFRLPDQFLSDKPVVLAAVIRYPEVLLQSGFPKQILDDADVFRAYLDSDRNKALPPDIENDRSSRERFERLSREFGDSIRGNAKLMLEAARFMSTPVVFEYFSTSLLSEEITFALELAASSEAKPPNNALERFSVNVRANRAAVLAIVQRNGVCLKDADDALKSDVAIIRAACKDNALAFNYSLPGPARELLIGDEEFMLNIFSRWPRWPAEKIFGSVSPSLSDNAAFAKRLVGFAATVPGDALGHFSSRTRANHEVVLGFVQKNGLCLKDADQALQNDETIVRAACEQNSAAIRHTAPSGSTRQLLLHDKEFMLGIFSRWHPEQDPDIFHWLPNEVKIDRDIVVAANKSGCLSPSQFPRELSSDREFWLEVIKNDETEEQVIWRDYLPEEFTDDPTFARAISWFENLALLENVLLRFPFLSEEREFWSTVIGMGFGECWDSLSELLRDRAPDHIRQDKELMVLACQQQCNILPLLSQELQQDRDILVAAVEDTPGYVREKFDALLYLPQAAQIAHPDLTVRAISNLINDDGNNLNDSVAALVAGELWTNLDIWKAWFESGGGIHSHLPLTMKENSEFGLLVAAEHPHFFRRATSEALRSNKEFMKKAVETNLHTFQDACGALHRDFDLAVIAFSNFNTPGIIGHWEWDDNGEYLTFMKRFAKQARAKIENFNGFMNAFVFALSPTVSAGPACHLSMCARDEETSAAFKKLVGDYVGLPKDDEELRRLCAAATNMEDWIENWTPR